MAAAEAPPRRRKRACDAILEGAGSSAQTAVRVGSAAAVLGPPCAPGARKCAKEPPEEPLGMSSDSQTLAEAELDPMQAQEEPVQENASCSPGQLPPPPPEEASGPKSYCQAWLLAPLEDARYLICCTNWY